MDRTLALWNRAGSWALLGLVAGFWNWRLGAQAPRGQQLLWVVICSAACFLELLATWARSRNRVRTRLSKVVLAVANYASYFGAVLLVVVSTAPVQLLAMAWFIFIVTAASRTAATSEETEPISEPAWAQHDSTLHDLSNAMTASLFMVRDITRAIEKGSETNLQRALRLSKDLARELSHISDHISSSRQSVRLQLVAASPVSLFIPIRQSVEHVSRLFPAVVCRVHCDVPEQGAVVNIVGGVATLKRIVENLVINACQAQGDIEDKRVDCHVSHGDGVVTLTVSDKGPGFSTNIINSYPNPLVSTKLVGSGMGLYSCHQLVIRDGGTLRISNRETGGARITVSWPQATMADRASLEPSDLMMKRSGTRSRPSEHDLDTKTTGSR